MHRLDKPRLPGIITQRFTQLVNADHRRHVGHVDARPERFKQCLLCDYLPRMLSQISQHCKGLATQDNGGIPAPELLVGKIQRKRGKDHRLCNYRHVRIFLAKSA
jgi:hypothetical protein